MKEHSDDLKGKMVLGHEPVGQYRNIFLVTFISSFLYLAWVLFTTW
ncbi:MAG: hypothetical protein ACOC0U_00230 [Desulfovibrionales bacterium]